MTGSVASPAGSGDDTRPTGGPRRRPVLLGAAALVVVLVVAGALWWVREPYATDLDALDADRSAADPAAAAGLAARTLAELRDALDAGDPAAARALAPAGDPAVGDLLAAVADNAVTLRVEDLSMRYLDELEPVAPVPEAGDGAERWLAAVEVGWRFDGFADETSRVEVPVAFERTDDGVAVAGVGGEQGPETVLPGTAPRARSAVRVPLWLAGPLEVRRTTQTLVLVAPGPEGRDRGADEYAALARDAVAPVAASLGDWDRRLVVEVPTGTAEMAAALGAPVSSVAGAAAVTAAPDGDGEGRPAVVGVYVNPEVFDGLDRRAAQLVMTHEAVHVATRAPGSPAPTWLVEGFADVVAVADSGVDEATAAAQVAEVVRADGVPEALPTPADFDTGTGRAGPVYESAWIACVVLAEAIGTDGLERVYERTDDGRSLDAALADEGLDVATLTRRWQDRLRALADAPPVGPTAGTGSR